MTTLRISRQCIGGVIQRKDHVARKADGPSVQNLFKHLDNDHLAGLMCVSSVPFSLGTNQFGWKCPPKKP